MGAVAFRNAAAPVLRDAVELFSSYLRVVGLAHTGPEPGGDPLLVGKRLGIVNGSSWVTLWSNYFGRLYLPGVHLLNAGNEAVQVCFMEAHEARRACPPEANIEAFVRYAQDLVTLGRVDAVLLTCSTMNRAFVRVAEALRPSGVPVVQIDGPMMERAVAIGGKTLVVATHGPTVTSTQALLDETAAAAGAKLEYGGVTVAEAWDRLAEGDVAGHNRVLSDAIRRELAGGGYSSVVLAQLSMAALLFTHPEPEAEFGLPVLTSARCGFERVGALLRRERS